MRLALIVSVAIVSGCQKPPSPRPALDEPAFRKPSATEIFNLRSKCAELGEKIINGNTIGIALDQEQFSHYDPKSNRCYVELSVHTADVAHLDYAVRYLYDGQTGEMLAWSQIKKGVKTGFVDFSSGADGFDAANTKIEALMADDRKQ
jgi:hypothetical protein